MFQDDKLDDLIVFWNNIIVMYGFINLSLLWGKVCCRFVIVV